MNHRSLYIFICISIFSIYLIDSSSICETLSKISGPLQFFQKPVTFYLYNREYRKSKQLFITWSLRSIKFDPSKRTTVIVHGFFSNANADWILDMVDKLLRWEDMNVITVDWSKILDFNYLQIATQVRHVGQLIKDLLMKLATRYDKELKDWHYLHFIGHSLGAHAVGQAALLLMDEVYVHRVTGLDPAAPLFHDNEGKKYRLNKTYARFVDVIHTSSNPNEETFGLFDPMGHIDFYPNSGDRQPACRIEDTEFITASIDTCISFLILGIDGSGILKTYLARRATGDDMACDHSEASQYFIQSINNTVKFLSTKVDPSIILDIPRCTTKNCTEDTCIQMGINAEKYNSSEYYGTYYLDIPSC